MSDETPRRRKMFNEMQLFKLHLLRPQFSVSCVTNCILFEFRRLRSKVFRYQANNALYLS